MLPVRDAALPLGGHTRLHRARLQVQAVHLSHYKYHCCFINLRPFSWSCLAYITSVLQRLKLYSLVFAPGRPPSEKVESSLDLLEKSVTYMIEKAIYPDLKTIEQSNV